MQLFARVLAVLAVMTLSGCLPNNATITPTLPAPAAEVAMHLPLFGQFVTQGAATAGIVSIVATAENEATLTLSDFSTGPGDDLRLQVSPGPLVRGADGYYYVETDRRLELPGKVDPALAEQTFVIPLAGLDDWEFASVTIFDYPNATALGSAALTSSPIQLPVDGIVDGGARGGAHGETVLDQAGRIVGYVVAKGDSAALIADRFTLRSLGQLVNGDGLNVGTNIAILAGETLTLVPN